MGSAVWCRAVAAAIDQVDAGLDVLVADGWVPDSCPEALVRVRELEQLGRRMVAVQLRLQAGIDRSGVFKVDGHASAKVMVRHGARLSRAHALRREQAVKVLGSMPAVARAFGAGRLGVSQLERLGRVFANRRVREQLIAADEPMCRAAVMLPYPDFDAALSDWERLVDEDGAGDRAERSHANRDFRMPRNFDGSVRFEGGGGSVDGAELEAIWQRQVQREWDADWADARCRCGDAVTVEDLARTDAQRRFDAMSTCMRRGDLATYGVDARTSTNLVIDQVTFERHVAKLFGTDPGPDPRLATWWDDLLDTLPDDDRNGSGNAGGAGDHRDRDSDARASAGATAEPVRPADPTGPDGTPPTAAATATAAGHGTEGAPVPEPEGGPVPASQGGADLESDGGSDHGSGDGDPVAPSETAPRGDRGGGPGSGGLVGFRCGTIDGHPLDPTEVVVATLIGQVRRVVVGADGVVLDMGRATRLFTGARQLAVRLADRACIWTGCEVPSSQCQCDHTRAFNGPDHGTTTPANGGPCCGRHNRLKERGYTASRDRTGRWHVHRPDGTEIT